MRIEYKHYGVIKNGKKIYYNPDLYKQQIAELEGKSFVEVIKEKHEQASLSQYAYYRGVILPICHKSEYFFSFENKDQIHDEYFAPKFLSYKKLVELPGKKQETTITRSLADLNIKEMSEFIDRVIAFCSENGIVIPDPLSVQTKYYSK